MSTKVIGYILIVAGLVLLVVSLIADSLGIGGSMGFGWKQMLGAGVGVIAMILGVWLGFRKPPKKSE